MKAVEHAKSSEMVHPWVLCSNISGVVKLEFNVLEILKRPGKVYNNIYLEQCSCFLF